MRASNVVYLDQHRPGWRTGQAVCMACKHEWIAVAPVTAGCFECPHCGLCRGQYRYQCAPNGAPVFSCGCGNEMFTVHPQGVFCPNCGDWKDPWSGPQGVA